MRIRMIYLAAGSSRRFGENKLLYPLEGKPLYRHGLDTLTEVLQKREETLLTVVSRYDEILNYAEVVLGKSGGRITAVNSPESEGGISYSVRAGLRGAEDCDYYLFFVADQPYIKTDTVLRLIDTVTGKKASGGYICAGERSGNPAMFSKELLPELEKLTGDRGGKRILTEIEKREKDAVCRIEAGNPRELEDVDEPL